MARPKRKEIEIEQTRRHIAFTAAAIFTKKGYSSTSMAEVAKASGYTPPSLYKYFDGKDAIVSWLYETLTDEMTQFFQTKYPKSLTFRQRLELLQISVLDWIEERKSAYAFLLVCQHQPLEETEHFIHQLEKWFDSNSSLKERHGMDSFDCAVAFHGLAYVHFFVWFQSKRNQPPQYLPDLLAFFFAGMEGFKTKCDLNTI